jgi:hypothetical protein
MQISKNYDFCTIIYKNMELLLVNDKIKKVDFDN